MEQRRPSRVLSIVALAVSIAVLASVLYTHLLTPKPLFVGERVYRYETLTLSGAVYRTQVFSSGTLTMIYYYKDGEETLSWTDIPVAMTPDRIGAGDTVTIVKEYKVEYTYPWLCEHCGLIVGKTVKSVEVQGAD